MVVHPKLGSNLPIGSDRESGRDSQGSIMMKWYGLVVTARGLSDDRGPSFGFDGLPLVGVMFFRSFPLVGVVLFPSHAH